MHIDDILSRLHGVKKSGSGWTARCPAHEDKRSSLSLTVGDDGRILLHDHAGCTAEAIIGTLGIAMTDLFPDRPPAAKRREKPERIVATYPYCNADGVLQYEVVRTEPKGFKQRRPTADGNGGWIWDLKGVTPLLYRLPRVLEAAQAGKPLFIVEGEKDVDTLTRLGITATCNSGGAGKFPRQAVEWIKGAKVAIIPDSDTPGRKHADAVARLLHGSALSIRIVPLPDGIKDVTEYLEAGHTRDDLSALCRGTSLWKPDEPATQETQGTRTVLDKAPFLCLGYAHDNYFYLSQERQCLVTLNVNQHLPVYLQGLAPISFWEKYFMGARGVDWDSVRDAMFRTSAQAGVFDDRRLRGCGAWRDEISVIVHRGDHLLVDGKPQEIRSFRSHYIYEIGKRTESGIVQPLGLSECSPLLDLLDVCTFERNTYRMMYLGWLVLAPICGALSWRPHVWLTGPSGCGKSRSLTQIASPILGPGKLFIQGNTTEAGIRQDLGLNAWPVIFDEIEADPRSEDSLRRVLELTRQSSSRDGGYIVKGTPSGRALRFYIRSMFAFAAIKTDVMLKADLSRISILRMVPPKDPSTIEARINAASAFITPEWCARFRMRSAHLIPQLDESLTVWRQAFINAFGGTRPGDQLGSLFAGMWSLHSDKPIALKAAEELIDSQDWSGDSVTDGEKDEDQCINTMMQAAIQLLDEDGHHVTKSIGELVFFWVKNISEQYGTNLDKLNIRAVKDALRRHGITISGDGSEIFFADSNLQLTRILKDSGWSRGWKQFLGRINGHRFLPTLRFGYHKQTRATGIPVKYAIGDINDSTETD